MKAFISKAANHSVFANLLMIALLAAGFFAVTNLQRERLPQFSLDRVNVVVPYPDALPSEVEEAICLKIEQELEGFAGIKKINSVAAENVARISIELDLKADSIALLNEIKNKIDSINTFPDEAEKPQVSELFRRSHVIDLTLYGEASERSLKEIAQRIEDDLLALSGVTQVSVSGIRPYEISIEISEIALREYGLTFPQVTAAIKGASSNIPGGTLRTKNEQVKVQTTSRKYTGKEYENLVIVSNPDGTIIRLRDVAKIEDGFEEEGRYGYSNNQPAVLISVYKTTSQDAITIAKKVRKYCLAKKKQIPKNLHLEIGQDLSRPIHERIDLLVRNGTLGFVLVLLTLGLFLNLRLSFWVALGIPISFGGGLLVLWFFGKSLNMISMFAMIMALGMVVDDAIVVGENIHTYRQKGLTGIEAAIRGTIEMMLPITAAVTTSIIAFLPMFFIPGIMGKIVIEIPAVMVSVLVASLLECLFILPAHLSHENVKPQESVATSIRSFLDAVVAFVIHRLYKSVYFFALRNRAATVAVAISIAVMCMGIIHGGQIPFIFFPKLDEEFLKSTVVFPEGTPISVTRQAVKQIEAGAYRLNELFSKNSKPIVKRVYSTVGESTGFEKKQGANIGSVNLEIIPGKERSVHSRKVIAAWRQQVGEIAGALSLSFGKGRGHGNAKAIEFVLKGGEYKVLRKAATELKEELANYKGVYDIEDDYRPGKLQIVPKLKPAARLLGIDEARLGNQLFQGFSGQEVFRLQREANEIKVKVRYPEYERNSFSNIEKMRIRLQGGTEIPLSEVATFEIKRGPAQINRQNGKRRIKIIADVNLEKVSATSIIKQLKQKFLPKLLEKYPELSYALEGRQQNRRESSSSLAMGLVFALFGIYAVLAIVFHSYLQPLIIMAVIPFGYFGAVLGHWALGYHLTMMSMFGIVALAGVVVNDSLVLINRINTGLKEGLGVEEAVQQAGLARFRAITLTTLTTIAGLTPITLEQSMQAQFVIPMAISLASGLLFATFLTLFLIPVLFLYLNSIRRVKYWLIKGNWPTREEVEPGCIRLKNEKNYAISKEQ